MISMGYAAFPCHVIDGVFSAEDETRRFNEATITREAIANGAGRDQGMGTSSIQAAGVNAMREWGHDGGFSSMNADVTTNYPYTGKIARYLFHFTYKSCKSPATGLRKGGVGVGGDDHLPPATTIGGSHLYPNRRWPSRGPVQYPCQCARRK